MLALFLIVGAATAQPSVTFAGTPLTGPTPLGVHFTATALENTSYKWGFGNGDTSTDRTPYYVYNDPGLYSVTLATNGTSNGVAWINNETKTNYITATVNSPTARFRFTPHAGGTVAFNSTSTGDAITAWAWDFGDATGAWYGSDISHTYTSNGIYNVSLMVTNSGGVSDSCWQNVSISPTPLVARFYSAPSTGINGTLVNFVDTSTGNPTGYSWVVHGSVGTYTGHERNMTVLFNYAGIYNVTLTVSNADSSDTAGQDIVISQPQKPVARFNFTQSPLNPANITFTSTSIGEPTHQLWYVRGNLYTPNADVTKSMTVYFNEVGTYNITLAVSNAYGTDTMSQDIVILPESAVTSQTKLGVYKDGNWYIDSSGDGMYGAGDNHYSFGLPFWTPVTGDWNADGKTEMGVYRDGIWYLDTNGNDKFDAGDSVYSFGLAGWSPIVGDWNHDGKDEIGVFREGVWYLDMNGDGVWSDSDRVSSFGLPYWIPMIGKWR